MEGVGLWNKKPHGGSVCTLLMLLLFPTLSLTKPHPLECPLGDFLTDDGICCNKCAQGFKFVAACQAEGQRTTCVPCEEGQTYMDQMNYTPNCKGCKRCKTAAHEVMVSPCTKEHDTVCRCEIGFYKQVIGSVTDQCIQCRPCGLGEIETYPCTPENNTVCECEEGYYRHKNKCLPCKDCTTDCERHCPTTDVIKKPAENEHESLKLVLVGVGVVGLVLVVVVGFVTYKTTKQHTKRRMLSSSPTSDVFPISSQSILYTGKPSDNNCNHAVPYSPVSDQEPSSLPDCIPLEIKFSELIYTVLDLVPVPQVKQLVRSLGVTDTEIERAEADHRACKEAHYQMLRMWAERGSQSRGGSSGVMLHRPLLQELLDKLSSMQLGWAVEELQTKYGIQ